MAIFHSYWPYVSLPEGTKARQARCLVGVMSTKDIYLLLLVELQMERGPIAVLLVAWDIRRTQLVLMWDSSVINQSFFIIFDGIYTTHKNGD